MKKYLALLLAIATLLSSLAMVVSAESVDVVNVTDYISYVENAGAANENWTPAIAAAIAYAVENGIGTVYIPAGTYKCEPDLSKQEEWEGDDCAAIYLPDAAITIKGDGDSTVLTKGTGLKNITAMFRTAYQGTAAVTISDLKILGRGNPGPGEGLIDGIVLNGSDNGTFNNITISATKRHGFYFICGADNNTVNNAKLSDMNRECLGCALQFEGSSGNTVNNVNISNVGGNGIDLSVWNTGGLYPSSAEQATSPYSADFKPASCNNKIIGGSIKGTGIQNGITTATHDDDYYGINIIKGSNNNEIALDYVGNIRLDGINSNAAAVRIGEATGNVVTIEKFRSCSNAAVKISGNSTTGNTVTMNDAADYRNTVLTTDANARTNNAITLTTTTEDHVLKASINFSNGDNGTQKYATKSVFGYNPFGDFTFQAGDKIAYEYLLGDDAVAGMGTLDFQGNSNWATMESLGGDSFDSNGAVYKESSDMTKQPGFEYNKWTTITVTPNPGITSSGDWSQGIAHLVLSVKATAEVDTSKTYSVYYRNIRVLDSEGNTRFVIYDGKRALNVGGFDADSNASMVVEEATDPTRFEKVLGVSYEAIADGDISANPSLYSLDLVHAPASLFDYELDYTGAVRKAVAKPGYTLKYDYAIDTADVGLGNIYIQESTNWWGPAENADLKNTCNVWNEGMLNLSAALCGGNAKGLHNISFGINIKGAKAGTKYNAYFRNLRIVDEKGNIVYKIFDPTITTTDESLCPQDWGTAVNCSWTMGIVNDPFKPVASVTSDVLKATVTFTEGAAGVEKEVAVSLYGWGGEPINGFVFQAGDKIAYDYLVEDSESNIAGLGTLGFQSDANPYHLLSDYDNVKHSFGSAYKNTTDLTGVPGFKNGYWVNEIVEIPDSEYLLGRGMGHFVLSVKTSEAVVAGKEYVVYYRNIRVIGADGKTRLVIFDGSQQLNASHFAATNAGMVVTKEAYSAPKENILVANKDDIMDIAITFSNAAAGAEKKGEIAVLTGIGWADKKICATDVITYDIWLDSPLAGVGGIAFQENVHWGAYAYDNIDLSSLAYGKWYTNSIAPIPNYGEGETALYHFGFTVNCTDIEVVAGKEYHMYIRNLRIVHADGSSTPIYSSTQMDLGSGGLFADQKGFTATANKQGAYASQLIFGDFDGNGEIGADDIVLARKVLLGAYEEGTSYFYDSYDFFADINNDDKVNIIDLIRLKKALAA